MRFVTSSEICDSLCISKTTLMNWKRSGKIKFKALSQKKVLYDIDSIASDEQKSNRVVIYARVSNTKQKSDLDRQINVLSEYVVSKGHLIQEVISEIASGMNEERKGLQKLLSLVFNSEIDEVVISYKDRLTRFGFKYFETVFSRFGVKITVVNLTNEEDFQTELTQDLISIIHHFSMKLYSNRRKIVTNCKNQLEDEVSTVEEQ